jgi:thioesterase domain-containing protein
MLEPQDRLAYLVQKTRKVPKMIKQNIKNKYRKIAPKFYEATGRTLPPALIKSHNAILKAYIDYMPQIYPGRVTLFRAKTQLLGVFPDPTLGWDGLAAEGLEIHEIPGFHGAMMAEPRVRFMAEKLADCLAKARAAESSRRV